MKKILALLVSTFLINNAYCMDADDCPMYLEEDVQSLPPTLVHFCEASKETQQSTISSCFDLPNLTKEQMESLTLLLDMTTYGQVNVVQCSGYLTYENQDDIDKILTQGGFFQSKQQPVVESKSSAAVQNTQQPVVESKSSATVQNTQQPVAKNKLSAIYSSIIDDIESSSFECFCGLDLEEQREIINSNVNKIHL